MRCPYCHTKISNKVSFCSSCGKSIKKRRGRLPLSILAFFVVFLVVHICASNIWEVDENNVLQVPDWYVFFLLGISVLAAVLTNRLLGPKKMPAGTIPLAVYIRTDRLDSLNSMRSNISVDPINQTVNRIDNPIETFTPTFSVITSDGEISELQGDYAKVVFLWETSTSVPVKSDNEYARCITHECGIRHPQAYHEEMIRQGYLEEDSEEKAFMYLKVPELKALTAKLGVSSTGKKQI